MAAVSTPRVPEKSLGAVLLCTYLPTLNKYMLCIIRYNNPIRKLLYAGVYVGVNCDVSG